MITRLLLVAACPLVLAVLFACGSSPIVSFYTLSVESASDTGSDMSAKQLRIAVGPISIPEIVDRPQMVVRSGPNQVILVEEHRWAESLNTEIPRIIAENLSRLLSTEQVWAYPQVAKDAVDYRVAADIQRFESVPGQSVAIEALWSVQRISEDHPDLRTGRSSVQQPVAGQSYEALAAAHSRALAAISREIATVISAVPRSAP